MAGLSAAGQALGFGGSASVADQMPFESEEEKRKRLQAIAAAQARLGNASSASASYGGALSPAGAALGLGG